MAEETAEDVDVTSAEQEAAEAEALVASLERKIREGDDGVSHDQLTSTRSLAEFARLRVQGIRAKAAKARAARRTAAAEALRAEVEAYAKGVGGKLADGLRAIQAAEDAFVAVADEHDAKVLEWRKRANALGIPESDGRPMPPAEDGRLALPRADGSGLQAGRRHLELAHGKGTLERFRTHTDRAALVAVIARLDAEQAEPEGDLYFYRGAGGGVHVMDHPIPDEQLKRDGITVLTREEAWGE